MDKGSQSSADDTNTERRGIFSTPELTVDAEKIAESTAAATEASRAKIASIFANTETGRQSQRLNDAMVANSQPATEDIVINNGPKKKRRWPLVVAVVILLAAVGGVVTFGALSGWFGGSNGQSVKPVLSESDVVDFANYALSEDGQQVLDNGYIGTRAYRLEQQVKLAQVAGNNAEYFDNLGKTFDTMYNNAQGLFNDETNFTNTDLNTMRDRVAVIRQFVSGDMLTVSEIASLYLIQGNNIMRQTVESTASRYDSLENNAIAKEYAAVIREVAELIVIIYDIYGQHGCIQNDSVNAECVALIPDSEAGVMDWNDDRIVRFIYDAARRVEQATFVIYGSINK